MRIIPSRVHGMLDYLVGILLIPAPWIFGFAEGAAEMWVPVIVGIGAVLYSMFTDCEAGAVRRIPVAIHLMLDLGSGALLALSPWLFGFAEVVRVPHLVVGLVEIGAAPMTERTPRHSREMGLA